VNVRLRDFDVIGLHDRVDVNIVFFGRLPYYLPMNLAACRHINSEIALYSRQATEALALRHAVLLTEPIFRRTDSRQIASSRDDAVLR
jgi:hypothetical protein